MSKERDDLLIEANLLSQMCAFHDVDDKETREQYAREYFEEFCKDTKIDPEYAFKKLEDYIKAKRETTMFKYEHYEDLRGILGLKKPSKGER